MCNKEAGRTDKGAKAIKNKEALSHKTVIFLLDPRAWAVFTAGRRITKREKRYHQLIVWSIKLLTNPQEWRRRRDC